MTMTIAVLGLGAMGSRMAQRLLGAGFSVRVYNRSVERRRALEDRGAMGFDTPRDAAAGTEVVLSMVRDDDASARVWLDPQTGALAAMKPGALGLECSTLSPGGAAELGAAARARGLALLDAPVVGSRPQAEACTLVFLVGGEAEQVAALGPVFEAMGTVRHVGRAGQGAAMKLAVNALFGIQVAALAELLAALREAGIDPARALEVLGPLAVCSPAAKGTGGLMVAENYAPMFPVELVEKDFGYALGLAERGGHEAPVSAAARGVFAKADAEGLGHENLVAVAKLYSPH